MPMLYDDGNAPMRFYFEFGHFYVSLFSVMQNVYNAVLTEKFIIITRFNNYAPLNTINNKKKQRRET